MTNTKLGFITADNISTNALNSNMPISNQITLEAELCEDIHYDSDGFIIRRIDVVPENVIIDIADADLKAMINWVKANSKIHWRQKNMTFDPITLPTDKNALAKVVDSPPNFGKTHMIKFNILHYMSMYKPKSSCAFVTGAASIATSVLTPMFHEIIRRVNANITKSIERKKLSKPNVGFIISDTTSKAVGRDDNILVLTKSVSIQTITQFIREYDHINIFGTFQFFNNYITDRKDGNTKDLKKMFSAIESKSLKFGSIDEIQLEGHTTNIDNYPLATQNNKSSFSKSTSTFLNKMKTLGFNITGYTGTPSKEHSQQLTGGYVFNPTSTDDKMSGALVSATFDRTICMHELTTKKCPNTKPMMKNVTPKSIKKISDAWWLNNSGNLTTSFKEVIIDNLLFAFSRDGIDFATCVPSTRDKNNKIVSKIGVTVDQLISVYERRLKKVDLNKILVYRTGEKRLLSSKNKQQFANNMSLQSIVKANPHIKQILIIGAATVGTSIDNISMITHYKLQVKDEDMSSFVQNVHRSSRDYHESIIYRALQYSKNEQTGMVLVRKTALTEMEKIEASKSLEGYGIFNLLSDEVVDEITTHLKPIMDRINERAAEFVSITKSPTLHRNKKSLSNHLIRGIAHDLSNTLELIGPQYSKAIVEKGGTGNREDALFVTSCNDVVGIDYKFTVTLGEDGIPHFTLDRIKKDLIYVLSNMVLDVNTNTVAMKGYWIVDFCGKDIGRTISGLQLSDPTYTAGMKVYYVEL